MLSNLLFGENLVLTLVCGILAFIAFVFFIIVYVADFKESRRKARKKRDYERALDHAQRRRQRLR